MPLTASKKAAVGCNHPYIDEGTTVRSRAFDGFWQVTLFARAFPVNVYLVDNGHGGLTLIDTGLPMMASGIQREAATLGKPITRIALTHAHYDHVGGLDALAHALPGAEVVCSAREAAILGGDLTARPGERASAGGRLPGRFKPATTKVGHLVDDGAAVGPLIAVATPGHTPGHTSYFHEPSGTLFTGDALSTRAGLAVAGDRRPLFPFVALATWDKALAVASARKAAELPPRHLAPGHGEVLANPGPHLDAAITRAATRLG